MKIDLKKIDQIFLEIIFKMKWNKNVEYIQNYFQINFEYFQVIVTFNVELDGSFKIPYFKSHISITQKFDM